jgi:hypothetical protein
MNKRLCSTCGQESIWKHDTLEDCVNAQAQRIAELENNFSDLEKIVLQCVERLDNPKKNLADYLEPGVILTPEQIVKRIKTKLDVGKKSTTKTRKNKNEIKSQKS